MAPRIPIDVMAPRIPIDVMAPRFMLLDAAHNLIPATLMEWGAMMHGTDRHVGLDQIGPVQVSTVFPGLDHGFGGVPLYFETMTFGGTLDGQDQWRCTTWAEAEAQHAAICAALVATHALRLP